MIGLTQHRIAPPQPPLSSAGQARITAAINTSTDIVIARQRGRQLSLECGCSPTDATLVATIISELARNALLYARGGEILLENAATLGVKGIRIVCCDAGPGIADVQRALAGGYSTSGGLGMGLSGVRRLVDEFNLKSDKDGTVVTVIKWLYRNNPYAGGIRS